jgi:DNA-binding NarL/FixJ family response regulator
MKQDDNDGAVRALQEALAIQSASGDAIGVGESVNSLANLAHRRGDLAEARRLYERALAAARLADYRVDIVLHNLGLVAQEAGDLDAARQYFEESVEVNRLGDSFAGLSLAKLGEILAMQGDVRRAREVLTRSLALHRRLGDVYATAFALERFAILASIDGRPERALQLAGAASALREQKGTLLAGAARAAIDGPVAAARASLRPELADASWARGREMSIDEAVSLALAEPPVDALGRERRRPSGDTSHGLTPREREVALYLARGSTNRQIAAELVLAERTVDVHVSNILGKLGLSSRAQVAAWVVTNHWLGDAAGHGDTGARR